MDFLAGVFATLLLGSMGFAMLAFVLGIMNTSALVDPRGEMKRGFKVRSDSLSKERHTFLESVSHGIVDTEALLGSRVAERGFIKRVGREVLIQYYRGNMHTSWPYVGYVDLDANPATVEYRGSLLMHLALAPFLLSIVGIPFVMFGMFWNYRLQRDAMFEFIDKHIEPLAKTLTD